MVISVSHAGLINNGMALCANVSQVSLKIVKEYAKFVQLAQPSWMENVNVLMQVKLLMKLQNHATVLH